MGSAQGGGGALEGDRLFAALMPKSEFVRAVGRFEGDATDMLRQSVLAAGRAFDELDACHAVLDRAAEDGTVIAEDLRRCLAAESEQEILRLIGDLDALADQVRRSEAIRVVVDRILGQGEQLAVSSAAVAHLTEGQLPRVPTPYDDENSDHHTDLDSMLQARADRLPEQAHAKRLAQVANHLVAVVVRAVEQSFVDGAFAAASLAEARSAYVLWSSCLAARRRDLE